MKTSILHFMVCLIGMVMFVSCASSPASFYTLNAVENTTATPLPSVSIAVEPVSIPESIDRPQMVLQKGTNEVMVDELNRWAASPRDSIQRVVMENLSHLLGTSRVYRYLPGPITSSDYRIEIEVLRFDATLGQATFLDAIWTIRKGDREETKTGRTTSHQKVADQSYEALAAAHSQALGALSRDMAKAIQSLEQQKGAANT